jgi:hypothetical protein
MRQVADESDFGSLAVVQAVAKLGSLPAAAAVFGVVVGTLGALFRFLSSLGERGEAPLTLDGL